MTESTDAGIIMTSMGEDVDSEYMPEEDDPTDRYDAARWLRKRVGVVAARDLPAEPSEEDFRLGLRSGTVLCNVLNKIRSGSVPKVVNAPSALFNTPDAAAQSAYVENVRNFLTAIEEMGLPTFEPADLEPGGDFSSVVDSVLAMKAYSETGAADFTWTPRPSRTRKTFLRRNSEPAMNAFSRTQSVNIDQLLGSTDQSGDEDDVGEECDSGPLYMIVSDLLEDRDEEDIPIIVENILNKLQEEFNGRLGITPEDDDGLSKIDSPRSHSKVTTKLRSTLSTAKTDVRAMQNNCQDEADNLGKHVHTLCQAAAGYKKVLEENRKLYNQVQDLKGSIRVYCRVRPFLPGQENQVTSVDYMDDETVTIIVPSKSGREGRKASMFNKVFGPTATQEEVFSDTQPLIRSVLDGFNVCVFACGQTGAGKTYTLSGPEELTPETMGVNYRALNDLFLISEERKNLMSYEISINMLEIYNDEVWDLLVTDGSSKPLEISNLAKKGINVPDATLVPVSSTDEVKNLMSICQKNRSVNDRSSRAHSFLTAHVFGKDLTSGLTTRGCMHLVDLAGNEKLDNADDEATHINKSLTALGDVLVALANKSSRVSYKTCKLTQLLQDALGAQAKILMFVHVHPDINEALETLSTFKFVERFSTVEGGAGKSLDVRELKEQVCYLKAALAKKEAGDPGWQDLVSSPRGGDQNGAFDDEQTDESASKAKNPSSKQPAKSASVKKPAAGTGAAAKPGKQPATPDAKKKKGK